MLDVLRSLFNFTTKRHTVQRTAFSSISLHFPAWLCGWANINQTLLPSLVVATFQRYNVASVSTESSMEDRTGETGAILSVRQARRVVTD